MTIRLLLSIRVLTTMSINSFAIPCRPETLEITRHPSGSGYEIRIFDTAGEKRHWFAVQIISIAFDEIGEHDARKEIGGQKHLRNLV